MIFSCFIKFSSMQVVLQKIYLYSRFIEQNNIVITQLQGGGL